MASGFFITGTDTGVGKTIVSAALIQLLSNSGYKTGGMKPVESGCGREGDILIPYDGMFLKHFTRMDEHLKLITPCRFETPLAPLPASDIEKTKVNIPDIRKAFDRLSRTYQALVVEGIGGLMVPLRKDYLVLDLIRELGLPLIVVTRPGLGTINHTMLTVNYALKEGLEVAGFIINYCHPPEGTMVEESNPKVFSQICPVPHLGTFPYLKSVDRDMIEKAVMRNLDIELFRKYLQAEPTGSSSP